ncbi:MAG: hypothetical protein ABMA64_17090 [Myxococcota bacterium]
MRAGGDLDGDGYADLLAADPAYTSVGGSGSGQVWVIGGGATPWAGNNDLAAVTFATIDGVTNAGYCGWDVAGLGDFSGDGATIWR